MADNAIFDLYNDDGSVYLDLTTYAGAFYGSFSTGGQTSGTVTDSRLVGRTLLHFCPTGVSVNGGGFGGPACTLNNSTGVITWSYPGSSQTNAKNDTVFYGGF